MAIFFITNQSLFLFQWTGGCKFIRASTVIICVFTGARRSAKLKRYDVAKMFNIEQKQFARYERGKQLLPAHILEKLFYYGFVMMFARRRNK